jgi:hypothetical protein
MIYIQRYIQNFSFGRAGGGGADPQGIYNLDLILNIML